MEPDLTVVIVTYNSQHVIEDLLDSLPAGLQGLSASVVVVDNGSSDGTVDLVSARNDSIVVPSTNVGYSGGINCGVRESKAEGPILVLNPDVRLEAGSVRSLLNSGTSHQWGIVVPRVLNRNRSVFRSLRREPSIANALGLGFTRLPRFSEYVDNKSEYSVPHVVDWALGAVMLITRQCYDTVGGFDESYFLYSEETDFCLRARDLGFLTGYEPTASVVHIGGQSGTNERTHAMQIVNRVRLFSRRHSRSRAWVYWTLTILSELSWVMRGHRQSATSVIALTRPKRRPVELRCSDGLLPI